MTAPQSLRSCPRGAPSGLGRPGARPAYPCPTIEAVATSSSNSAIDTWPDTA